MRIGCVPYLNAAPLVYGIEHQTVFEIPSLLADQFAAGRFDVALIPLFEALRFPDAVVVDGLSISCFGGVFSVILASRCPVEEIKEVVIDPASRTSVHLLRLLLSEHFGIAPEFVSSSSDPLAARLIIGDPAMEFQESRAPGWRILDLGKAWLDWTGLPFVFAVWTVRNALPNVRQTASALREIARQGLAARSGIAVRQPDPAAAFQYLTQNIRYGLGPEEKLAISRFRELLVAGGFLSSTSSRLVFV